MKNSNNLKGLLVCQICQSRHGHRKLLPKELEGPEGLLHFSEIPMSLDHSGRLENAPKHALPNGNTGTLPFAGVGSQKLVFMFQGNAAVERCVAFWQHRAAWR